MFTLEAGQILYGKANTAAAVVVTVFGHETGAVESYPKLGQPTLAATPTVLYTTPASTAVLVSAITFANITGLNVAGVRLYAHTTTPTDAHSITGLITIPANGTAILDGSGLHVYDSAGVLQFTGTTGPSGTVAVNSTTNLVPASAATVVNVGTPSAALLDFGIPVGSVWRSGAADPTVLNPGVNGDYYLRTATLIGEVYLKAAGVYSSVGNIRGATGLTGAPGVVQTVTSADTTLVAGGTATDPTLRRAAVTGPITIAAASNASVVAAQTGTGSTFVMDTSPTILTPTIASFTNAQHNHSNAAGGGNLPQSSITSLVSDLAAKQPLDSDLTAIAALTTTSYGRAFLELVNQAGLMALLLASSETASGIIEIATQAETNTGTDDLRAVTPLKFQTRLAAYAQPLDADLTAIALLSTTSYGRALLELANQAALLTAIGTATETQQGIGEIATTAEVTTGTDDTRLITPLKLQQRLAAIVPLLVATSRVINATSPIRIDGGASADLSADRTISVLASTETNSGVLEIATTAETTTGTDDVRSITPLKLAQRLASFAPAAASETVAGVAEIATTAETTTGTDDTRIISPLKLAQRLVSFVLGTRSIATTAPLTGGGDLTADRTLAVSDATFTARGTMTAAEKIAANSQDGRTSTGTNPRVFRPGDYMVGNTYDPTGAANSTSTFSAMMTAIRAWNDRFCIELPPGVFKIDHDILKDFGTNNPSFSITGPGRGCCILLPNAAPTGFQSMITMNRNTTGSDSVTMRGFTIYNTSGTPYTAGSGILTNGCDAIDITEVAFIDLYVDIQVSGQPYNMTTVVGASVTGISPAVSAADNGMVVSGPGIVGGTTFTFVSSSSGTLSIAATAASGQVRFLNNSIKVSIQKMVSFNTNGSTLGSGIYVSNGQAGDTYMGPDIVMSDGGGTTRRRGCIVIAESGHYEITQANLTGSQRGIDISPDVGQVVGFGFHTNVLCDSNTVNGMRLLSNSTGSVIKNIKSVNSWYSGTVVVNGSAAAAGCLISGTSTLNGFTFTTDRFLNNRTHGCEYVAGTDVRFSDCDMKGNSSIGSGTADGLNVAANVGDWSINGGKYGGTDTIPGIGNQRYGIFVAAGTGNNIKVSPDSLTGNVTGPISFGATGVSNFLNGCPGLASPYMKPASSGNITTVQTVSNMFIPKNSQRVSTTYRLTARYQHSGLGATPTFTVRYGATNDAVGAAATNAIVVSAVAATGAASAWGWVTFDVTITALGPTGSIQGSGSGAQAAAAFSTATAGRVSGAGFLTVATDADRYLTLAFVTSVAAVVHNASIEITNY